MLINNIKKYFNVYREKNNMMDMVVSMYITLIPLILTGIFNMVFCTTSLLKKFEKPLDGGRCFKDGKRLFGDNKTYKGLVGYVVIGIITTTVWGGINYLFPAIVEKNYMYVNFNNTFIYNTVIGALLGLAYAIFELPNSFLKRRFDVIPGKTANGIMKYVFILLDQGDSVIGCVLVIALVYPMSVWMYLLYVLLGMLTHFIINIFLYIFKLRKNIL